MQIFIVGTPFETGIALDKKRLSRQISEAQLIYDGILGQNGWRDNILSRMYKEHLTYLRFYIATMKAIKNEQYENARIYSDTAQIFKPKFQTRRYLDNMKSRLYTKDPVQYRQWSKYGTSDINMYFVDNQWKIIKQK